MLVLYRHLFITGEESDGRDGELDNTNGGEDNASVADSSILQAQKSQTPSLPASSCAAVLLANEKALERRFDARISSPIWRPRILLLWYIADQLALNHADEGIDIDSRSLIESFRPDQYICIKLTDVTCEMTYLLKNVSGSKYKTT